VARHLVLVRRGGGFFFEIIIHLCTKSHAPFLFLLVSYICFSPLFLFVFVLRGEGGGSVACLWEMERRERERGRASDGAFSFFFILFLFNLFPFCLFISLSFQILCGGLGRCLRAFTLKKKSLLIGGPHKYFK
jgi:hypothetical protein